MLYKNPDTTGTYSFHYFKMGDDKLFFSHYHRSRGKIFKALSYTTLNSERSFSLKDFLYYSNNDSISFNVELLNGDTVILKTNWNAPNGKVVAADINQLNKLIEIVPEYDITLRSVNRLGKEKITCIYRNSGKFVVMIFNREGEILKKIDFPEGKKSKLFFMNMIPTSEYTNFCISSFYHPDFWYQLSLKDLSREAN